ncbi:MAG TPA: histidine phosphatase family protein [Ornithinicoccus sp.]|nr:histidine phosphatase family protein [Ornithinicoccus sp.]
MTSAPEPRRRLLLVRHAKAEQGGAADHDRELTDRGRADARAAGEWLAAAGLVPELVVCSTAARAAQTWQEMAAHPDLAKVEVWKDRNVYNADAETLLEAVSEVPEDRSTVAVVGHAPGVPDLAVELLDEEDETHDDDALTFIAESFPTMACAVLEVPGPWSDLAPGTGVLRSLHVARGG